jgi:cytochrome c-type biogenesis protein CcmE
MKIGLTAAVLVLAFTGLLWSTLREGTEYYKHVDEVLINPQEWEGKRLQLHGHVVTRSILVKPDTLEYKFQVQNNGKIIHASYRGVVPDTFKDRPGEEAEVVLKGRLTAGGAFHVDPNGIMAKCPSKYEAAKKVS